MLFDPATGVHLKPWLVRTLEPICDAEPGALADYLLALLKHDVPEAEMRKELTVQLDEFLEKAECPPFIDTLFTVLRTKSYLPYGTSASTSADTGIPIPIPASSTSPDRTRKRSSDNDERDGRPPAKGPRLSSEGQFSRYSNGRGGGPDSRSTGGWAARVERPPVNGYQDSSPQMNPGGMGMNGGPMNGRRPQPYLPPDQRRGICRDYHNNGYCSRGAYCKFSHGDDAVVPGQLFPMNGAGGMPFMPMFAQGGVPFGMNGGAGPAYDPHEARMDMRPPTNGAVRPQPRAPLIPRAQQEGGSRMNRSGELPVIQDLTPQAPDAPTSPLDRQRQLPPHVPLQSPSSQMNSLPPEGYNGYDPARNGMNGHPMNGNSAMPMDVDMSNPMDMGGPMTHHHSGGFRGGRGGSRGKGVFNGEVHKFNAERRNDKTLVVEKIPEDKLTLEHVNDWFKRFGTVTNVAIDSSTAKALVSFSNHEEAHAAWKSEDAVFNNRFVKLFWHRPMEGHGQVGARMLAASAPMVANIVPKPEPAPAAAPAISTPSRSVAPAARKTPSSASTALAAKQQLLEKQIAEQKALMASLSTASPEEKKEIMGRLRKLGEEMTATPAPTSTTPPVVDKDEDMEKKERERLDKELELHSATAKVDDEESTEDLKAKLERLKAEAASLGLSETGAETSWGGSYRPYRGRGRGARSYYRGAGPARGGPPRASMKLDNRPKKLLVKGVKEDSTQAVRDWYETTGQVDSLTTVEGGDIVVTFRTRNGAEQGLAKGNNISLVGPVQVAWYTGAAAETNTTPTPSAPPKRTPAVGDTEMESIAQTVHSDSQDAPLSPGVQEEEVASGWGDGDEDGMGML
ncbi:hypothetical protein DFH08DRAFT_736416 [Mycena albidolilacea]|uniref:Uncharacterized protein n=1 Tax=Mycena albidolilacea TaxID=1033008 RepID=A0AAD7AFE6_9AGAR|nr:hypothetical protein DFH08DRAFT_736416 [Mycena albidolilacea]